MTAAMLEKVMETTVDTEILFITPEMAAHYLATCQYDLQRKLRSWHVTELAEHMRRGKWRPYTTIRFNKAQGVRVLVDGQHRLSAVVESGRAQEFVVVTVHAANMEEVAEDYVVIDTGTLRNVREAIITLGLDKELGLEANRVSLINSAARIIEGEFLDLAGRMVGREYLSRSREQMRRRIEEWGIYGVKYLNTTKGHRVLSTLLRRVEVFTVGILTVRHQGDKALAFWGAVAANDGLLANSPEWKLVEYLRDSRAIRERPPVFVRKVAACWNAYHRGEEKLSYVYARDLEKPILIEGTPFRGRQRLGQ